MVHANYWLSGIAGRTLKQQLQLPLLTTFHTLARVKAIAGDFEPESRARAEAAVMACADVVLANAPAEAEQLVEFYDCESARIEIVPPGVDHALFSPGNQAGARWALRTDDRPLLLFVGRIQPLKGADVAVETLARIDNTDARLWIIGGSSGNEGDAEVVKVRRLIDDFGLTDRVEFKPPRAPPPAVHLLPSGRRHVGAEPVGVVRSGGTRVGGLRYAYRGVRRRRVVVVGGARPQRLSGRGPRPGYVCVLGERDPGGSGAGSAPVGFRRCHVSELHLVDVGGPPSVALQRAVPARAGTVSLTVARMIAAHS